MNKQQTEEWKKVVNLYRQSMNTKTIGNETVQKSQTENVVKKQSFHGTREGYPKKLYMGEVDFDSEVKQTTSLKMQITSQIIHGDYLQYYQQIT